MRFRITGLFFLFILLFVDSLGQGSAERHKQLWGDGFIFYELNPKWSIYGQIGYRNLLTNGSWQQVMTKPSVSYAINDIFTLHTGLFASYTFSDDDRSILEIRPWQGIKVNWPEPGKFYFNHFLRFEERTFFFEDEFRPFTTRIRFQTGVKVPLNNYDILEKTWYIYPYIEFFFDINPKEHDLVSNVSRYNLTLGYMFNETWAGELAVMEHRARNAWEEDFEFKDFVFRGVVKIYMIRDFQDDNNP